MHMRGYDEIIRIVTRFLNEKKIPYMLVGAVSVAYYGMPRTSADIDIVIQLGGRIGEFAGFLKKNHFSVDEDGVKLALDEKSHFTVFDDKSPYRLDVKGVYTELGRETFRRRRKVNFYGQKVWINSPEDVVVFKLLFRSEKDLTDAKYVLLKQGKGLDKKYLEKKVKEMKLEKIYLKVLRSIKDVR